MKFSNILLIASLAYKCVFSKDAEANADANTETKTDITNQYEENIVENKDFNYKFRCLDNFNNSCDNIKKDLNEALNVLSNTYEFYQPVTFEVIIDDLSKYGFGYATGGSMDINYIALKQGKNDDTVAPYLYAQALAKQLNLDSAEKAKFAENDFILALNNFRLDPMKFSNYEVKRYTRLILREIIHAMGFSSLEIVRQLKKTEDLIPFKPSFVVNDESNSFKYLPSIIANIDWKTLDLMPTVKDYMSKLYESKFIGLSPLSAFSKFIVDSKTKKEIFKDLGFIHRDLNCFKRKKENEDDDEDDIVVSYKDVTEKHYYDCYNALDDKKKEALSSIANDYFFKDKSIGFLTSSGKVVPLQTFDKVFHPRSSIMHTQFDKYDEIRDDPEKKVEFVRGTFITKDNIEQYYDAEALMYYSQGDSITNEVFLETIGKKNEHGFIGQGTFEILKTMGWTEKGGKRDDSIVYYVDENENVTYPEQNTFKLINMKLYDLSLKQAEEEARLAELAKKIEEAKKKEEQNEEQDEEQNEESKEESKEEQKEESKEEPKEEPKEEQKEEKKEEQKDDKTKEEKPKETVIPPKLEL